MGAKCSRTAPAPQLPDETLDDMSVLELNDSAIDHMPVGYSVRRRQAVNILAGPVSPSATLASHWAQRPMSAALYKRHLMTACQIC